MLYLRSLRPVTAALRDAKCYGDEQSRDTVAKAKVVLERRCYRGEYLRGEFRYLILLLTLVTIATRVILCLSVFVYERSTF